MLNVTKLTDENNNTLLAIHETGSFSIPAAVIPEIEAGLLVKQMSNALGINNECEQKLRRLEKLVADYGFFVIEKCDHCVYRKDHVNGACPFSDECQFEVKTGE